MQYYTKLKQKACALKQPTKPKAPREFASLKSLRLRPAPVNSPRVDRTRLAARRKTRRNVSDPPRPGRGRTAREVAVWRLPMKSNRRKTIVWPALRGPPPNTHKTPMAAPRAISASRHGTTKRTRSRPYRRPTGAAAVLPAAALARVNDLPPAACCGGRASLEYRGDLETALVMSCKLIDADPALSPEAALGGCKD
jgi:hypothetical protein